MKRNKPKNKKLCGRSRDIRLRAWGIAIVLMVAVFSAFALGHSEIGGGIVMVGAGVTLLAPCGDTGTIACDPCAPLESGRVSGIGLSLVPLTDMTSQAEWVAKALAGTALLIPAVNGEYAATPTKQPGMGRQEEKNVGIKHTLKFDWDKVQGNVDVVDKLNYEQRWYVYWVTDKLIYSAGTVVNFSGTYKIEKTIDSKVMFQVDVTWNYPLNPSIGTKPALIFDQCVDLGDGEDLGTGFGFTAKPLRATLVTFVSGTTYDITYPLGIVNNSVPNTQATFDLSMAPPAGFTLITLALNNTGVGAVAGNAVVRVDTSVATGWRELAPDALGITIAAGLSGSQDFNLVYSPCDLGMVIDGIRFVVTSPADILTFVGGASGNDTGIMNAESSCYYPGARTVEFGGANTLPGTATVVCDTVTVTGLAQAIDPTHTGFAVLVGDGSGTAPGSYLVHLVFTDIGTDFNGGLANPSRNVFIPVVVT